MITPERVLADAREEIEAERLYRLKRIEQARGPIDKAYSSGAVMGIVRADQILDRIERILKMAREIDGGES